MFLARMHKKLVVRLGVSIYWLSGRGDGRSPAQAQGTAGRDRAASGKSQPCLLPLVSLSRSQMPESKKAFPIGKAFELVAERTGLEPATPGVTGRYSNQLNYRSAVWLAFC